MTLAKQGGYFLLIRFNNLNEIFKNPPPPTPTGQNYKIQTIRREFFREQIYSVNQVAEFDESESE